MQTGAVGADRPCSAFTLRLLLRHMQAGPVRTCTLVADCRLPLSDFCVRAGHTEPSLGCLAGARVASWCHARLSRVGVGRLRGRPGLEGLCRVVGHMTGL